MRPTGSASSQTVSCPLLRLLAKLAPWDGADLTAALPGMDIAPYFPDNELKLLSKIPPEHPFKNERIFFIYVSSKTSSIGRHVFHQTNGVGK